MSMFTLTIGLVVRRGERTWRLDRQLENHTLVFGDQLTGQPLTLTVSAFWRDMLAKRLVVVTGSRVEEGIPPNSSMVVDWTSLEAAQTERTGRALTYVRAMQRCGLTRGMRTAIQEAISEVAKRTKDAHPPSASTVMGWMRRLDRHGGLPTALIDGRSVAPRRRRVPEAVLEVARTALSSSYCSRSRPTLVAVRQQIERELRLRNSRGAEASSSISHSTVVRLRNEIDPYQRDVARFGAAYARNRWRYSLAGTGQLTRALERYEVDHTLIDMVVVCDRTGLPLGRPTITIIVDAYSHYVVGLYISFWGTGLSTTFAALKVALAPKDQYVETMGLSQPWLGMGVPELMVVDNGLEFHSQHFKAVALNLAIDLQYCAVRQPWLKPHVERSLGSYLQQLPAGGRIRRPASNELPIRPEDSACLTFSDLCEGVIRSFVEVHPMQINQRKLARPFDLFAESLERLPPPALPTCLDELDVVVAPSKMMTVGNEGVVHKYLRYNSRELQDMRRETGTTFKTSVKFNPEDLDAVWVQHPKSLAWLPVPSCSPKYTEGLSMVQHQAIRQHAADALRARGADVVLQRAKDELADMWRTRSAKGRRLKTTQLRGLSGLTSNASLLDPTFRPQTPREVPVAVQDVQAASRVIPEFDAFVF